MDCSWYIIQLLIIAGYIFQICVWWTIRNDTLPQWDYNFNRVSTTRWHCAWDTVGRSGAFWAVLFTDLECPGWNTLWMEAKSCTTLSPWMVETCWTPITILDKPPIRPINWCKISSTAQVMGSAAWSAGHLQVQGPFGFLWPAPTGECFLLWSAESTKKVALNNPLWVVSLWPSHWITDVFFKRGTVTNVWTLNCPDKNMTIVQSCFCSDCNSWSCVLACGVGFFSRDLGCLWVAVVQE